MRDDHLRIYPDLPGLVLERHLREIRTLERELNKRDSDRAEPGAAAPDRLPPNDPSRKKSEE